MGLPYNKLREALDKYPGSPEIIKLDTEGYPPTCLFEYYNRQPDHCEENEREAGVFVLRRVLLEIR